MMEAEQYDQAVFFYTKAQQSNPDDEEIAEKLAFARSSLVAGNLIKVRMFRQSELPVKAAKKLNSTLDQMTRWKVMADSAVKSTIEEEVELAARWLNRELKMLATKQDYNRFGYSLKQYNHIIDSGLNRRVIAKHLPSMNSLGQRQCQDMQPDLTQQSYYMVSVWRAYCANFGQSVEYALGVDNTRYTKPQLSARKLKITNAVGVSKSTFVSSLTNDLQNHIWFSNAASQPLTLTLSGKIHYQKRISPHTFTSTYKAKEETFELVKDPVDPKIIKRKLVHVKPVEKTVKLKGKRYTESVSHHLKMSTSLQGHNISGSEQSAKQDHITHGHQAYFKQGKVTPLNPKMMNKSRWFAGIGNKLISNVKSDLDASWVKSFCDGNATTSLPRYENAARCAQLKPLHPTVAGWTQNQFGLNHEELTILLR